MTNSGKLLLKAINLESRDILIRDLSRTIFGPDTKFTTLTRPSATISKPVPVIVHRLPSSCAADVLLSEIQFEYPSATKVTDFIKKGSGSEFKTIKIDLSETSEVS